MEQWLHSRKAWSLMYILVFTLTHPHGASAAIWLWCNAAEALLKADINESRLSSITDAPSADIDAATCHALLPSIGAYSSLSADVHRARAERLISRHAGLLRADRGETLPSMTAGDVLAAQPQHAGGKLKFEICILLQQID